VPQLQSQWLLAHMLRQLPLPTAAAMRADIARQRAWRSAALAHPLMSTHGSLARAREHHYVQQLLADLDGGKVRAGGKDRGAGQGFPILHSTTAGLHAPVSGLQTPDQVRWALCCVQGGPGLQPAAGTCRGDRIRVNGNSGPKVVSPG
jgi:hypothetical protein